MINRSGKLKAWRAWHAANLTHHTSRRKHNHETRTDPYFLMGMELV
jgi:hypothetical protein